MEADIQITIADINPVNISVVVADFNKIRLVSLPDYGPLDVLAINEIKKLLATDASGRHNPYIKGYAIDAGKLYTYPAVAIGTMVDFLYYKKIPYMVNGSMPVNSNVFSIHHQDALLYASLLAGAPYMRENADVPLWENQYVLALMAGSEMNKHIKMGSTPLVRRIA